MYKESIAAYFGIPSIFDVILSTPFILLAQDIIHAFSHTFKPTLYHFILSLLKK